MKRPAVTQKIVKFDNEPKPEEEQKKPTFAEPEKPKVVKKVGIDPFAAKKDEEPEVKAPVKKVDPFAKKQAPSPFG